MSLNKRLYLLFSTGLTQETSRIKKREVSHNFRYLWLVARIMNVKLSIEESRWQQFAKRCENLEICCACSSKCIQLTTGGDNRHLCSDDRETDVCTGTKDLN